MFSKQIYPKLKNGNYNARQKKASLHTQSVYDKASFLFLFFLYILKMKEKSEWWLLIVKKEKTIKRSRKINISMKYSIK